MPVVLGQVIWMAVLDSVDSLAQYTALSHITLFGEVRPQGAIYGGQINSLLGNAHSSVFTPLNSLAS